MRDALSLLDRCFAMGTDIDENTVSDAAGIAGTIHLFSFSEFVAKEDFTNSLKLVSKLHSESCDIDSLCTELTLHFRNLMVAKTFSDCEGLIVCSKDELSKLKERADQLKLSKILECIEILEQTSKNIKNAVNKKIQLEAAVIRMCSPVKAVSGGAIPEGLEERIEKLEEMIKNGVRPAAAPAPVQAPVSAPVQAPTPAPAPKEEVKEEPKPSGTSSMASFSNQTLEPCSSNRAEILAMDSGVETGLPQSLQ